MSFNESLSTIASLFSQGGLIAIILLLLSILSLSIILERFLLFLKFKSPHNIFVKIDSILSNSLVTEENKNSIRSILNSDKSFYAHLIYLIIENSQKNKDMLVDIIKVEIQEQVKVLEKRMTTLNIIATISPLLGLLGTVIGMITSFLILAKGDNSTSSDLLAKGISQALITTAAGLVVAIPSIVAYNYFSKKINMITDDLTIYSIKIIDQLKK